MKEEEIIKKVRKNKDDSIVFKVRYGNKKIKEGSVKTESDFWRKVILLDNVPLVTLSEKKYPSSPAIIKVMRGRSAVSKSIQDRININLSKKNIDEGFNELKPLLKLFDDGDYELRKLEMIPTDGEGNCFWSCSEKGRYYNASSDIYYHGRYIKGFPKFLIPSKGNECLDEKKVDYYREKIRNGEELFGVALELKGFMALLLDGHHKATAAYLEGENIKCLTIKCCNKDIRVFEINEEEYKKYDLQGERKIYMDTPKEVFPDYMAVASVRDNIDTSNERINKLFRFESNRPIEELENILCYLTIHNKERAKKLCVEILKKSDFQIMWTECLNYLSRYKDKEVHILFENILSNCNIKYSKNYENSLSIVENYLKKYMN